jgi:hypothetical protein
MTAPPLSGPVGHLDQVLRDLEIVCCEQRADQLQLLAESATSILTKLRSEMKHSQLKQVADLLECFKWDEAKKLIEQYFPGGSTDMEIYEELLTLLYVGHPHHLFTVVEWVGRQDAEFQTKAFKILFERMKNKGHVDFPQSLLVTSKISKLPDGVLDDVRVQLDSCQVVENIIDEIASGAEQSFSVSGYLDTLARSSDGEKVMRFILCKVVHHFNAGNLDNTTRLIMFWKDFENETSCFFVDILLKELEERSMLESENAFHLWACAKYLLNQLTEEILPEVRQLCSDALNELDEHRDCFFERYQSCIEDGQKIRELHDNCPYFFFIVPDFVTWYYREDDLTRVEYLITAARAIYELDGCEPIMVSLFSKMERFQQLHTFEAFRLFSQVHYAMTLKDCYSEDLKVLASFEKIKAKAPACLRLLLWPENHQVCLVNKFFATPLCSQEDRIVCSSNAVDKELLCKATVDTDKELIKLSLNSGDVPLAPIDAWTPEGPTKVAWDEIEWKLRAVDQHHVKICNNDGNLKLKGAFKFKRCSCGCFVCL